MHRILTKQKVTYGIYLVEPLANLTFNRGLLMNIGFAEAIKDEINRDFSWNCFFFHDSDMIPQDERIIYKCYNDLPAHYAVDVTKWNDEYNF